MAETTLPPDGPENLVLRYLRRIDERLDTVERKLDEVITRLSSLEYRFAGSSGIWRRSTPGSTTSIGASHGSNGASTSSKLQPAGRCNHGIAIAVAARNDDRPDARSRAISDARSLRLKSPSDARSVRLSAN